MSFHRQASRPISQQVLLASYLSAWLKRRVIPSPSHDGITPLVILSAILLVHKHSLGLLPAMVWGIQSRLRMLTRQFHRRRPPPERTKNLSFRMMGLLPDAIHILDGMVRLPLPSLNPTRGRSTRRRMLCPLPPLREFSVGGQVFGWGLEAN